VREAQMQKVNYILTIGEKEMKNKTLAVRDREGKTTFDVPIDTFIKRVQDEIKDRVL